MSLPWFRAYAEMVDDAKLRCLAFEDRWHYVAILCCKCQGLHEDAGQELLEDMIGVKLGLQPAERDSLKRRLIRVKLIDELWQPLGWSRRQFESDSSRERVRRYRDKKIQSTKQDVTHGNGDVTLQERRSDGGVTFQDPDPDPDPETDSGVRGGVGENQQRAKARPQTVSSRKAAKRGTRLDEGLELPDEWRHWAIEHRPDLDPDKVFERFRDYWIAKSGQDATKLDWAATWRNWVRNQEASKQNSKTSVAAVENRPIRWKADGTPIYAIK